VRISSGNLASTAIGPGFPPLEKEKKRGASMAQVEAQFGAPQQKFAAVGGGSSSTPPITRWKYGQFTVYFENSHVVNAVLNKASELEIGPAPVNN